MTEQDLRDVLARLKEALDTQQITEDDLMVQSDPVLEVYAYLTTLLNDWSRK